MRFRKRLAKQLGRCGALAAATALASAGVALGSTNAVKGASYTGHFAGAATQAITFTVSPDGRKVSAFSVVTPFKCSGGCGGVPSGRGGSASISKNGKFTVKLKLLLPGSSTKALGTDTVTGTFLKHGGAKGTVTSHFTEGGGGKTVSWTATG